MEETDRESYHKPNLSPFQRMRNQELETAELACEHAIAVCHHATCAHDIPPVAWNTNRCSIAEIINRLVGVPPAASCDPLLPVSCSNNNQWNQMNKALVSSSETESSIENTWKKGKGVKCGFAIGGEKSVPILAPMESARSEFRSHRKSTWQVK